MVAKYRFAVLILGLLATTAHATVFLPQTDRELVERSDAVVVGTVLGAEGREDASGLVVTDYRIRVEEVLAGSAGDEITVTEYGGVAGHRITFIADSAVYAAGERALLFLRRRTDGNWYTASMTLGKFTFARSAAGERVLVRGEADDVRDERPRLESKFKDFIRATACGLTAEADYFAEKLIAKPDATASAYVIVFGGKALRWAGKENPASSPIDFRVNGTVTGANSGQAVSKALGSWTNEPNSFIKLANAGPTTVTTADPDDGVNAILFDNSSAAPSGALCDGTLGCMVGSADTNPHTYKGETFYSIQTADILIRPSSWNQQALNSVLAHEMGHAIGIRHSNDGTPSSGNALMNSTVNFSFDGNLQDWDKEAVATVYGDGLPCNAPQINNVTGGGTIPFNQTTTLTVNAIGTAPLQYQWYSGNSGDTSTPLGTQQSQSTGAVTSTKTFWVRVSNACGNADSVTITVTASPCVIPSINTQPQGTTIVSGQSVSLFVGAGGSSPFTFQWYEGKSGDTSKPVGFNQPSFTSGAITSTTSFWARITNACGSIDSDTATITVPGSCSGPTVTPKSTSIAIRPGQRAVLMATGDATSYQWFAGNSGETGTPLANITDGTSNFVSLLYVDLLGRLPDAAGLAFYRDLLAAGRTRTQVATLLLNSAEVHQRLIADAYLSFLHRTVDPAGASYWLAALNAGLSDEGLYAGILSTPEYFAGRALGTNDGYIESLYQDLLGRPADPDAKAFWLAQLGGGTTRGGMATALLGGAEYRTRLVSGWYQRYLRRSADPSGQATLLALLNGGARAETALATLLGSPEYATAPTMLITDPLTATRTFWVRGTNSCKNTDSTTITVNVACDLAIAGQPKSVTIAAGELPNIGVGATGAAPITYQWFAGASGNTNAPIAGATLPSLTNVSFPVADGPHPFWVRVANGCTTLSSSTVTVNVVCGTVPRPILSIPPSAHAALGYSVRWTDSGANSAYELQEAKKSDFSDAVTIPPNDPTKPAQPSRSIAAKNVLADTRFYYRVRGIGGCNGQPGPYSDAGSILVTAPPAPGFTNFTAGVPFDVNTPFNVTYNIKANFFAAGKQALAETFSITVDAPWLIVTPSTGTLPADGSPLPVTIRIDPATLPIGSTTATMTVTTSNGSGKGAFGTKSSSVPITVSRVTPVSPLPKTQDPNPDALLIPAVAHADGINSRFVSDVRITNVSSEAINYLLNFVATQTNGTQSGKQTQITLQPNETKAFNDVVRDWFGAGAAGEGGLGTLEIRPELRSPKGLPAAPTSGGPSVHLATVAASRTYNLTDNGTFGQFIPAIPIAAFIGKAGAAGAAAFISLQQIAQSSAYRTNLGFVEGSGAPVAVLLNLFDGRGVPLRQVNLNLQPFEHRQIRLDDPTLFPGVSFTDGRLEVRVGSDSGKVTAYASVLDNITSDPLLVFPVQPALTSETRYVVPGVAELNNGAANFHTDLRIYNSGTADQTITLAYSPAGAAPPAPVERTVKAGEVLAIDNTLLTLWNISGSGGAVLVTTPADSSLVLTARTFSRRADGGTFGQFIPAVSPSDAVGIGERALEVIQLEQSAGFRSNLGLVEVTGKPVDLEITATTPDSRVAAVIGQHLEGNEFRQLGSIFGQMGFTSAVYNGRISVRVVGGEGKVAAYGSVVDNLTQDPTYVFSQ